jgi:hypothetical protein
VTMIPSYTISMVFLWLPNSASTSLPSAFYSNYSGYAIAPTYENPPTGYVPKLSKIGKTADKVYVMDGGRYVKFNSFYSAAGFDVDYSAQQRWRICRLRSVLPICQRAPAVRSSQQRHHQHHG